MKNVCFVDLGKVINSVGGAERVLAQLANCFAEKGYMVTIIASEKKEGLPFYKLDKTVRFYNIGEDNKLSFTKRLLRSLCKIMHIDYRFALNKNSIDKKIKEILRIQNIDIVINFFPDDLKYVLANKSEDIKVVQMLHGSDGWLLKRITGRKRDVSVKARLNEVDCLQVLLNGYKQTLQGTIKSPIKVISNIVPSYPLCNYSKNIVYLARYDVDKQIHLLIEIFNAVYKENSDWQLHVYGMEYSKGYKVKCEKLVNDYGLENVVFLHSSVTDVAKVLHNASICAFPSKHEGFGLGLAEAMSAGLACVGYKSCAGVNELIVDGENGFLVEDGICDFAKKLSLLMDDFKLCQTMGQKGRESIRKYNKDAVIGEWVGLIESLHE